MENEPEIEKFTNYQSWEKAALERGYTIEIGIVKTLMGAYNADYEFVGLYNYLNNTGWLD